MKVMLMVLFFSISAQAESLDFNTLIDEVEAGISKNLDIIVDKGTQHITARKPASEVYHVPSEISADQGVILVDSEGGIQNLEIDPEDFR